MADLSVRRATWLRTVVLAGAAVIAVAPGSLASGANLNAASEPWSSPVSATNTVVSTPTSGGGYPEFTPVPGGCVGPSPNNFNANHSESELAVEPGSEHIVGSSKFFFDKFSTR